MERPFSSKCKGKKLPPLVRYVRATGRSTDKLQPRRQSWVFGAKARGGGDAMIRPRHERDTGRVEGFVEGREGWLYKAKANREATTK